MAALLLVGGLNSAEARPIYFAQFRVSYPGIQEAANKAKCAVCHNGKPADGDHNPYGLVMEKAMGDKVNVKDRDEVKVFLTEIEKEKNETNGKTFGELIKEGKLPAEPVSE